MAKGPFDDELTPEEEALLASDATVPPAEEGGEGSVEDAIREAGQKAGEAEPAKEPAAAEVDPAAKTPAEPDPAAPTATEEEIAERDLAAFLEKHKGKTPEELARIALQQNKRANRAEATNRKTNEQISAIAERARRAAEERQRVATEAPNRKNQFREKLASDPDAATAELHDRMVDAEVEAAEAAAKAARLDQAIVFADEHIPEFGKQWPGMQAIAKEFGYTDAELDNIEDGRALVMLNLANYSARLMKAGIMDRLGNIVNVPQMETTPVDPRLAAPDPQKTLGGAGARSTRGAQTVEQQLAEINNMSDEEFNKLEPGLVEGLLKQAAA